MANPSHLKTSPAETERIWDPIVRITHWTIALAILLNGLLTEGGSLVHIWIGYVALAMLALRLVWGVVGTEEARFSAFVPSLARARAHLGDLLAGRHRTYRSHNPLGTLMVYALWATLAVIVTTGLMQEGTLFPTSPSEIVETHGTTVSGTATQDEDHAAGEREGDSVIGEIHGIAANLILILAALHIGGVLVESRLSRTNLAHQMISGQRPVKEDG